MRRNASLLTRARELSSVQTRSTEGGTLRRRGPPRTPTRMRAGTMEGVENPEVARAMRPRGLDPFVAGRSEGSTALARTREPMTLRNEPVAAQHGHRPDGRSDRNSEPNGRTLQR
jgi:hypothetical protein